MESDKSLEEKVKIAVKERDVAIEETMKLSRKYKQNNLEINNLNEIYLRKMINYYTKRHKEEQEEQLRLKQERMELNKELADLNEKMDQRMVDESKDMEENMRFINDDNFKGSSINNEQINDLQNKYRTLLVEHQRLQDQYKELNTKYNQREI